MNYIIFIDSFKKNTVEKEAQPEFNSFSDDGSKLCFKKLSENATTPLRGSRNAAGQCYS